MRNIFFLMFLLHCAFLKDSCFAQNAIDFQQSNPSLTKLKQKLEKILTEMHVPGMSIALVRREGPEWVSGLGKADLATERSATPSTLFRIGSLSKGLVSLAILKLADEGRLSLEDPIKKLASEVWFDNEWEKDHPLRLVHLLENTTGWDDMHLRELAKDPLNMTFSEALEYGRQSRVSRWPPGTRMAYSNSGPAVAAYIVEKITGQKFEEYIEQHFFNPIGMQTATYYEPDVEKAVTLYQNDGKSPLPYWNLLYRAIGSINASAYDMARYLQFYLNRGHINHSQVLPSSSFDRMEFPTSSWAAKNGLKAGYGLHNFLTIYEGFVYHGHDGNVPGGLSVMQYLPKAGIGYYYSINSSNREAFEKIGALIREYLTHHLEKPLEPTKSSLSQNDLYSGWYEPNSPRMEMFAFLERLIGMAYLRLEEGKLYISSLNEKNVPFTPVTETQFRYTPLNAVPDPIPTLQFVNESNGEQYLQLHLGMKSPFLNITMKRIPFWLAIVRIFIVGAVLVIFMSALLYAPFWIYHFWKGHAGHQLLIWPFIAILSLLTIAFIGLMNPMDVVIPRLGNMTAWSFSLYLATTIFAAASTAGAFNFWRTLKNNISILILAYSGAFISALGITTVYLAFYGMIGLRTWSV